MSLFGAMSTAISGVGAQSAAFGNISDNVANSQTVGFKRVDTNFIDYLTTSTAEVNDSGSVAAKPDYVNDVQGTVTQTQSALNLAITGQGFFAVSKQNGTTNGVPTFDDQQYYSRAGDFSLNKNGYLANSAGAVLDGWSVNASGTLQKNTIAPIQVTKSVFAPVATTEVTVAANLPATPSTTASTSSQIDIYDSLGTKHSVTLSWTQNADSDWTVSVNVPDDTVAAARGTAEVKFGSASGNGVAEGTVGSVGSATGNVTGSTYASGGTSSLSFTTNLGAGSQTIQVNLGTFGQANGMTQYAGTDYTLRGLTQNGVAPGSFSSAAMQSNGDVVVNYDNGQTRVIARVPVVTFADPDKLQRHDGQTFTADTASGTPLADDAGVNGAGSLVTSSVESSNVDIASEFSKLIVAQRAYSANTKVVTTADDLLQQTIDMKR